MTYRIVLITMSYIYELLLICNAIPITILIGFYVSPEIEKGERIRKDAMDSLGIDIYGKGETPYTLERGGGGFYR